MTSDPIQFYVKGIPKGQPRPRAFARKVGDHIVARVYDAGTAEGWKSQIAIAAQPFLPQDGPLAGPLGVAITFNLPRPKGHYGTGKNFGKLKPDAPWFYVQKPDIDNLLKAVFDALTTIRMWGDDTQIVSVDAKKHYAFRGQEGASIEIFTLMAKEKAVSEDSRLGTGAFKEQFEELKHAVSETAEKPLW